MPCTDSSSQPGPETCRYVFRPPHTAEHGPLSGSWSGGLGAAVSGKPPCMHDPSAFPHLNQRGARTGFVLGRTNSFASALSDNGSTDGDRLKTDG